MFSQIYKCVDPTAWYFVWQSFSNKVTQNVHLIDLLENTFLVFSTGAFLSVISISILSLNGTLSSQLADAFIFLFLARRWPHLSLLSFPTHGGFLWVCSGFLGGFAMGLWWICGGFAIGLWCFLWVCSGFFVVNLHQVWVSIIFCFLQSGLGAVDGGFLWA